MKRRWAGWELATAALAGVWAAALMPNRFYSEAVSEIVTVLGFLMAAFVPAMALAATAVRAGAFPISHIRTLGSAVHVQIQVFGGLFFYSLAACITAILGKLIKWSIPPVAVNVLAVEKLDISFLFPGLLTFFFMFLVLRSGSFVSGTLSILRLTTTIAEDEAKLRDEGQNTSSINELEEYQMPAEYGTSVHG